MYQRYALIDHGGVWGRGSQRGPEFSATTLHLVANAVGDVPAVQEYDKTYDHLAPLEKEIIDVRIKVELKTNRYNKATDTLTLTAAQLQALEKIHNNWDTVFKDGEQTYGFLPGTIGDEQQRLQVSRFFYLDGLGRFNPAAWKRLHLYQQLPPYPICLKFGR